MKMQNHGICLTAIFAFAAGTMLSLPVRAEKIYWNGGTGGSEAAPLEFYDAANWTNETGVAQLPDTADVFLTVDSLTYITNSASASTQIATALRFSGGDFVMLGPLKFNSFGYEGFSHSAPVSIDKRGDWSGNRFYLATSEGSSFTLTNRTGKLAVATSYPMRIANGTNSVASFVLEDGSLTTSAAGQNMTIGYGVGATGYFEQNGGTVSIAAKLNLGYNGVGNLTINNGTFTVRGDTTILGGNGGSSKGYLNLNGGTFETKYISVPNSNGGGTILFDGGTLKAATDGTLIQGVARILVRIGERGGTIDTAGHTVTFGKTVLPADDVTDDGGLAIVGGGTLNVISGNLRFEYNGRTTIELGTRVIMPTAKLGGGVTFTIPAGLAPAVYTPLTVSGNYSLESVLENADLPSDPDAQFVLSSDKKRILCLYKLADVNPVWIGGATGNLGDGANWSTGTVPQGGNCYFSLAETATLTSSASFRPDSITFLEGSQPVTINGSEDITGITVITNLSAVNHIINVPVRFADKIRVQQGAMAYNLRNQPHVVFKGGAYGTTIDSAYSRFISGHYFLSDDTGAWTATEYQDGVSFGLLEGSSVSVPYLTNVSQIYVGGLTGNNDSGPNGGAITTGVYRTSGRICRANQGTGEFVVTNELYLVLTDNNYLSYRYSDGWFKFEKVTIGKDSATKKFYFANSANITGSSGTYAAQYRKFIRVGAGGLGFENGLTKSPSYQFGRNVNDPPVLAAWHDDFTIGTKGQAGKTDVTFFGITTTFDTTDESGVGRTITLDALCDGSGSVNVTGKGAVVVNNRANTCSGAVNVSGKATLALNAGCPFGTGAVTVTNATLKANSSGTVVFASNVVCKANTALAFHFTEPRTAPRLAFNSAMTGNAMPAAMTVRITADEGFLPVLSRYTLTTGYDFTDTELTLTDPPQWLRSIGKDANGNIVIGAKTNGTVISVR